ncbi:hypothetical protein [Aequorivita sp. KMM 9714]|uniref:hypothetical protein n=1 Tax=Aequorivita sp. KMM 9714 TaxID=2707173 RepID=UPI0013ED632E|nr:hypothetical protein [Aequorivita sp. KMM 9714]NGX85431.1 hypothetical protein [Aequorivita sp. KMM 9714]
MRNETANKYLFTKYDALGRVAYTGFYTATIGQQSIQDSLQFNRAVNRTNYEIQKTTAQGATQIGDTQVFYSNSSYPSNNLEVLTINYYDRYVDYGVAEAMDWSFPQVFTTSTLLRTL